MSEYIYVIGVDGDPQMPTKRKRHVEQLLQTGRARVFRQVPFTIQLTYKNEPVLQSVTIAEDPGRSNVGMAVVSLSGELLSAAIVQTRNKEIVKLMEKRKQHRRASRNGERRARQRLAKKYHTMITAGFLMRKLPMYGKDKRVRCNVIKNTESRFCNRKRENGWLTPSAEHLVRTHINLIHKMQKFLPITDVAIEINRFAFLSLEDPSISGVDFQNGPLKGYDDLNAAVEDLQDGHCLMCNSPIEHRHHIVPRSMQGSNTIGNIAGLCCKCHERVHKDTRFEDRLKKKKAGLDKRYAAVSVLNQAIPFIERYGKEQTRKMISQLEVKESIRRYNRLDRLMPGAVFYYQGVRYVMRGQHSNGQYLQAVGMGSKDFPAKKCKIVANNEGLVFVS